MARSLLICDTIVTGCSLYIFYITINVKTTKEKGGKNVQMDTAYRDVV